MADGDQCIGEQQAHERDVQEELHAGVEQPVEAQDRDQQVQPALAPRGLETRLGEEQETVDRERERHHLGDRKLGEEHQRRVERQEGCCQPCRAPTTEQEQSQVVATGNAQCGEQQQRGRMVVLPERPGGHRHPGRVQRVKCDHVARAHRVDQVDGGHRRAVVHPQLLAAQRGTELIGVVQRLGSQQLCRHVGVQALVLPALQVRIQVRAQEQRQRSDRDEADSELGQRPADAHPEHGQGCRREQRGQQQQQRNIESAQADQRDRKHACQRHPKDRQRIGRNQGIPVLLPYPAHRAGTA